jgi:hypothetical protein
MTVPVIDPTTQALDVNAFDELAAQVGQATTVTYSRGAAHSGWDVNFVANDQPIVVRCDEHAEAQFVAAAIRVALAVSGDGN